MKSPSLHLYTLPILLALNAISIIAMQFIVPSMPSMQETFGVTPATVQLTLTVFMLGYAIVQIGCGPLSDRYGRKIVLIWSMTIFVVGSFLGAAAQGIEVLLLARLLQAIGAAAGFVLPPAVARDVYGQNGAAKAMSYISIAAGLAALVAPYFGGLVHEAMGWRAGMVIVGLLGILMLLSAITILEESHPVSLRTRIDLSSLVKSYRQVLRKNYFISYFCALAFINGAFYAFFAGSAFIAAELFALSPSEFGLMMIPAVACFIPSAFLSVRLAALYGSTIIISLGALVTLTASGGLLFVSITGNVDVVYLVIASALLGWGNGQVIPSSVAEAINLSPQLSGTASAALGTGQMGAGAIASLIFGFIHDGTAVPMALLMTLMGFAAFLSCITVAFIRKESIR